MILGKHLEESDLSDAEKRALLETIWSIVVSAVDLGFGVHPVQQAAGNICEQQVEIRKFIAEQSASVLTSPKNSKRHLTHPLIGNPVDYRTRRKKGVKNDNKPNTN